MASAQNTGVIVLKPPRVDPHAMALAAAEAVRSGQPAIAEMVGTQALQIKNISARDRAAALLSRGLARESLGRPEDAELDISQAIELHILSGSDLARAYFDRGVVHEEMQRTDEALADYSKAVTLRPSFPAALNKRGDLYLRLQRLSDAKADYEASIASGDRQTDVPYAGLGEVAEAQGDVAGARSYYRKALDTNPDFPFAAERLSALGGTPDRVVLHPPGKEGSHRKTVLLGLRPAIEVAAGRSGTHRRRGLRSVRAERAQVVQIGSYRSRMLASRGWERARDSEPMLSQSVPSIVSADLPQRGRFYRLRVAPPEGETASAFCSQLKARAIDCLVVPE